MESSLKSLTDPQVMWQPVNEIPAQKSEFQKIIENKFKVKIRSYWDLHKWSIENVAEFWEELWHFSGIIYSQSYEQVIDLTIPMSENPKWFEGARLNAAENMLKFRDNHTALIVTGEDRDSKHLSYAQLYKEVELYAAAFRKFGLKKNDRVICYMSNREEAVYAMLAVVSIGAIWTGALPLMGPEAVLNRFQQVSPRILITIDRFTNNKDNIELLDNVQHIVEGLITLEKVIVVPWKNETQLKDISQIKHSCYLDEFLKLGYNDDLSIPPLRFEQVSFSHPVFISYTSGTTGKPKALIHGAGCVLSTKRDFYLHNLGERDVVTLATSPVGWVSWNIFTFNLSVGVTMVLYEGVPYFLSPTYFWDLIDKFKITMVFCAPSILDDLQIKGYVPNENNSLSSLEFLLAAGSVVKPHNYDFVYQKIKKDIKFASGYGSTELMGAGMMCDVTLPIHRGEISCPSLAVEIECLNDAGKSVIGEVGELVISKPTPSLLLGLWGDTDGSKYKETYFSKFKNKFEIGDFAIINPKTKGIIIYGRCDETLKPKGWRFGSSEIYNIVNVFPEIKDSLCVSQYSPSLSERAVLFVQMKEGYDFNDQLIAKIQNAIENELTVHHVPSLIMETQDIPHNMNGKKMEVIVKKLINNMPYNDETVINKDSLDFFRTIPPYED